jgi:ankyrin repeat protein
MGDWLQEEVQRANETREWIRQKDDLKEELLEAAKTDNLSKVKYLLKACTDADKSYALKGDRIPPRAGKNIDDSYALPFAAQNGHLRIVKYLHEQGANIHFESDWTLKYAVEESRLEVVKYLCEHGADANRCDALNLAIGNGNLDIVRCLVDHGADVNAVKESALWNAEAKGRKDVIEYIESAMAKTGVGVIAIEEELKEATEKDDLSTVKELIGQAANAHPKGDVHLLCEWLFRWASGNNHLSIVEYLVEERGVNIRWYDDFALRWAIGNGHLDVIKYLHKQGADIRIQNDMALKVSRQHGHLAVVEYLESIIAKEEK